MFRKTFLAAVALAALLPASGAMAANAWTTTALNFREGPGTQYPVIHSLPHCAALTTYEWQNGWVRADWDGRNGWVSGRHIAETNAHCQPGYRAPAPGTPGTTRRTY